MFEDYVGTFCVKYQTQLSFRISLGRYILNWNKKRLYVCKSNSRNASNAKEQILAFYAFRNAYIELNFDKYYAVPRCTYPLSYVRKGQQIMHNMPHNRLGAPLRNYIILLNILYFICFHGAFLPVMQLMVNSGKIVQTQILGRYLLVFYFFSTHISILCLVLQTLTQIFKS